MLLDSIITKKQSSLVIASHSSQTLQKLLPLWHMLSNSQTKHGSNIYGSCLRATQSPSTSTTPPSTSLMALSCMVSILFIKRKL